MSTLSTLRTRLEAVQAKILEILETGQEYSVQGSHSVKNPSLEYLERQEMIIRKKILLAKGYTGKIGVDFEGDDPEALPKS